MRKVCLILAGLCLLIGDADAASRDSVVQKQASPRSETNNVARTTQKRTVTQRSATNVQPRQNVSRTSADKIVTGRTATKKAIVNRAASNSTTRVSRAATTIKTNTFGDSYNSCRDAYFTCMDQFCANQNETYRRCVCSSKLKDIQKTEKLISQTNTSLQSFEDINIDAISKNSAEVKAMQTATAGESAIKKDNSDSANTLNNISSVLSNTKKQSLSTNGKLDIGGDIKAIWSTTDIIGGADIANLSGEALFNAVHTQCAEIVAPSCASSNFKMVSSAYGMYIENDCAILQKSLDAKKTSANASIRSTRHKMQDARYENYNAHNSVSINDCIAKVREDLTAETACGKEYIHCLDFSGKYLNITTGEVIYSPDFYQIENQISLTGDILKNSKNTSFVTMLNKMRPFAEKDMDLCQDDADYVWDEFLRQAIIEIYQGQQKRVATVKNECLQVVNDCYLNKSNSLKQFSGKASSNTFVQTIVLSEEMCAEKLDTCSNLYGGGPQGLSELVATMTGITDLTIEQSCPDLLAKFAKSICAVSESDSLHSYPYGCRKYAPGESYYAKTPLCNTTSVNPFSRSDLITTNVISQDFQEYANFCKDYTKRYTSCNFGYYLYQECSDSVLCFNKDFATECRKCPDTHICPGGKDAPSDINSNLYDTCGQYYIGSLYQQLVIYALQNCTRTSDTSGILSESLLAEIDKIARDIRTSLISILSRDCDSMNGRWVDATWTDQDQDGYHDATGDTLLMDFYVNTGANKLWGYCKSVSE